MGWALAVFFCSVVFGQQPCVLEAAKSGDVVKIRAEAHPGGHDMFIRPISCSKSPENVVILVWADETALAGVKATVRRDQAFSDFNRLLKATFPLPANAVGTGQPRYRVVANIEGKLDVAPSAGLKRDLETEEIVGLEGFGRPMPYTRYRLVATGVSGVEFEQRPTLQ